MKQFEYEKVNTPQEASEKLLATEGETESRLIAGGTALVIMMKEGILAPDRLIDISKVKSMRGISYDEKTGLKIGSMTTHLEIEQSEIISNYYPSLKEAFHTIGNVRIRAVGTIGGNLAYAEPQCNPPAILGALAAIVHTSGVEGDRAIPADDFILGIFDSALKPGEVITEISLPPPKPKSACTFNKFTTKSETDKPTSTVATYLQMDSAMKKIVDCRIVVGAVGPKTYRCPNAENFAKVQSVSELDCAKTADLAAEEFEVMDDLYGPSWYKKPVVDEPYGPSWYKKQVTKTIIRDSLNKTINVITGGVRSQ
ncbi:MAG: xanthine dehydrogenase family protein subunit M [Thaumarchaeota archaeon]|nr:xanthine dehydrogenase family protein subunit M [Nitrososphaerota archaeon]